MELYRSDWCCLGIKEENGKQAGYYCDALQNYQEYAVEEIQEAMRIANENEDDMLDYLDAIDERKEALILNEDKNEIRVKVDGGYLVAQRNSDPDYDGICIYFETDDGHRIDLVLTECKAENNYKKTDVYCYEDVYTEDWTRKYTLDHKEIHKAINS